MPFSRNLCICRGPFPHQTDELMWSGFPRHAPKYLSEWIRLKPLILYLIAVCPVIGVLFRTQFLTKNLAQNKKDHYTR